MYAIRRAPVKKNRDMYLRYVSRFFLASSPHSPRSVKNCLKTWDDHTVRSGIDR